MELGYYDYDGFTGNYGPVTQEAIRLFQRTNGLKQDGIAGAETLTLLASEDALPYTVRVRRTEGEDVREEFQNRLKELGYLSGSADGIYGAATQKAVVSFQKQNGLSADGIFGQNAQATSLFSFCQSGAGRQVLQRFFRKKGVFCFFRFF